MMIEKLYQIFLNSAGISTDTRTLNKGDIFFALKGPNFNANAYAGRALDGGAVIAVIDDPSYEIQGKTILVKNVLLTLQQLSAFHRSKLSIPVLAITGSNGKTTTKELVNTVLSRKYRVTATLGNLNNHIGVPLTLLSIADTDEMAIIEMGANSLGEIAMLCKIAQPTHGLITNIGRAHTGLFGGLEGVIRAKSELYDYLIKNDGEVFINQHQPVLMNMAKRFSHPVFYPDKNSFYSCTFISANPFVSLETEEGLELNTRLIGRYNFDNIATALCVGKYFGVNPGKAYQAIGSYIPHNNRSQVLDNECCQIILDAYNANPSSMKVVLETFADMQGDKKAVILGDMLELGDDSASEHTQIGKLARKYNFTQTLFVGEDMAYAAKSCPGSVYFKNKSALIGFLKEKDFDQYKILIKGSRGMALEDIVGFI